MDLQFGVFVEQRLRAEERHFSVLDDIEGSRFAAFDVDGLASQEELSIEHAVKVLDALLRHVYESGLEKLDSLLLFFRHFSHVQIERLFVHRQDFDAVECTHRRVACQASGTEPSPA